MLHRAFCLDRFTFERLLVAHSIDCSKNKPLVIRFPSPFLTSIQDGKPIERMQDLVVIMDGNAEEVEAAAAAFLMIDKSQFRNILRQFLVSFAIYADSEKFIVKNGERDNHKLSRFC